MSNSLLPYRYVLAFGSNLGDRRHHCQEGVRLLSAHVEFMRFSPWQLTAPLRSPHYDTLDHEDYLNFVGEAASGLSPEALYREIVIIEDLLGHPRARKWQARQFDVDILLWARNNHQDFSLCSPLAYAGEMHGAALSIPHPPLAQRDFLLQALHKELEIPPLCLAQHGIIPHELTVH
jgi:2-amino-4-hydroxy-6-hydroxymethyldihydropteridine diphosphokinase